MIKLTQAQRKRLRMVAGKFRLRLVLAFGSEVQGETHALSDLDIAVLSRDSFNWTRYSNLIFDLEKVFRGKRIDLVFINRADPLLLYKISQSFLCLYGSKRTTAEFLILAFKRYQDYQPFFRLEERSVTNFITNFIMEG